LTTNPVLGAIDAVAEPLAISVAVNAGIFFNLLPSPSKKDAETLPLTNTEPVNCEPLNAD